MPERLTPVCSPEIAKSLSTPADLKHVGDVNLLKESLDDGILIAPFDCVLDRGVSYFLIYPPQRGQLPKVLALREWLVAATASALFACTPAQGGK